MRILFVYPEVGATHFGTLNLHMGLAYLSSYVQQAGHTTGILRVAEMDKDSLLKRVKDFKPDIVGISSGTNQWPFAKEAAEWIKEATGLPIIFGGWHATLAPEEAIAVPYFDYVCVGEGELPLVELLSRLEKGGSVDDVRGIWLRKGNEIIRNPIHQLIEDLDVVPFMDLEGFGFGRLPYNMRRIEGFNNTLEFIAGRGCPFSCTFCCAKAFRELYRAAGAGKYLRLRSPARTIEELTHHIAKYPFIDSIGFYDDTFTYSKKWLAEFIPLYVEKINLPFFATARADLVDEEILDLLKVGRCFMLFYGVETGNEELRMKVAKKKITNEQIKRAFRLGREKGIKNMAALIVGLPFETLENFKETKQLMLELEPDLLALAHFCPFPGSEAMEVCREHGWLAKEMPRSYLSGAGIEMPWFSSAKINECIIELRDAFLELLRTKKPRGYFDFAASLESAKKESLPQLPVQVVNIFAECYETVWLLAHPPASIIYENVAVRPGTDIHFAIGISESVYEMSGGGVEFTVTVDRKKVFSKRLDPKRNKSDRGWFFQTVPLDKFAGKKVSVTFSTEAFGKGGNQYCSAGWARPYLEERKPS